MGEAADSKETLDARAAERVRAHLRELLLSPQFKDTTRMKRLLRYIVDETLEGRGDRLKGYTIGLEVFDRPDDFDPQTDTIVRVQAGQLRRRLDLYYSKEGRSSDTRILVPKGTYQPKFEFRDEVALLPEPTDATLPRFARAAARVQSKRPGVIVLTFNDLTLSEKKDFFSEGLTAEIVNALVQFRYLRVVTRTATVTSSGPEVGVQQLAKQHGVDFVLTGNIRHAGDNVRVAVNLIAGETGNHIYSKVFDRRYTTQNLFDIQDEIASYVAASVAAPYGAITRYHRRELPNLELSAYEVILRYYEMNLAPSRDKAKTLREDIDAVIESSPDYSVPWAIRSMLDSFVVGQTLQNSTAHIYQKDALKSAERAVRLDGDNSLGFLALLLAHFFNNDMPAYETAAERCVMLNPNDPTALVYLASTQAFMGNMKDALALHERALELLPRPPRWFSAVPAIDALLHGQYHYVLNSIGAVRTSRGLWSQMLSLTAIGQLERPQVGRQLLDQLRTLHPDYDRELKATFLRWSPSDELKDIVFSGWKKAGMEI